MYQTQNDPTFAGYDEQGEKYYHSTSKQTSLLIAGPILLLFCVAGIIATCVSLALSFISSTPITNVQP